jgi:hypothetical protein
VTESGDVRDLGPAPPVLAAVERVHRHQPRRRLTDRRTAEALDVAVGGLEQA